MNINNDLATFVAKRNIKQASKQNPFEQTLKAAEKSKKSSEEQKLKEACDGFEEIFVHKMFQVMRSSSPKDGIMSGGRGEEIFQDMLDENYSKTITKNGSLGLSKVIYKDAKEFL